MSNEQQVTRDDVLSIYEADPILGQYVSHHPSNRLRLISIGAVLYMLPVGILQLIFWNADDTVVAIILPIIFAGIAGGILWWMLHYWNREVVLYQRGFSYRRGSATAFILYSNVIQLIQNIERVSFLGFSRMVYDYKLVTDVDEKLSINNIYSKPDQLTRTLETLIARDRLPIMRDKIAQGDEASFGESLHLTAEGIKLNDTVLHWQDFKMQRVKNGQLVIQSHTEDNWGTLAVSEIDNPVLLIALLREQGQANKATNEVTQSDTI